VEARDLERLEGVYRRDGPDVWRAIYAFAGGSRDVADETVAEAFAQAARGIGAIRDLRPWVYRAAFRIAAGVMANERRRRSDTLAGVDRAGAEATAGVELDALLHRLTMSQRKAFVMREVIGFSTRETASMVGGSEVAVRVHVHAARKRLRAMYEEAQP
jgi:RNA polymerase sigma-70 factor (ECF subfamily)